MDRPNRIKPGTRPQGMQKRLLSFNFDVQIFKNKYALVKKNFNKKLNKLFIKIHNLHGTS